MTLKDKNILLGVTAGIAAYKACELVRLFQKQGANVKVVLTPNAKEFVSPLSLASLSRNDVYCEQFNYSRFDIEHVSLAQWGDIFVIAPLTANTLSKIANGICDNLLTSLVCAYSKHVVIAPAMNVNMWNNQVIQENFNKLLDRGFVNVGPVEGYLACGDVGMGKMADIEDIVEKTAELLN
ncbi:MAG: hypothetical protein K6A44_04225 [bacterium]|nr:hypothetical protein [bacterium]